ncbi:integral membrane protein [Actinomyces sp. Chiba101]|uniref:YggT family protein n=1 Tax=Actinomyces denticolens TaxID=52767 RepID=A0ABY1ID62_9ACTO|nr:integral membrane protein [Actinomyces sp. Chiba101]GAV94173.1 integral membrane protein [Actinomyces denticolens]SHI99749.1 YggT family protein [Actinomyces denticolens]SUU06632.1 YGGT family [Actinomyces denticolens]
MPHAIISIIQSLLSIYILILVIRVVLDLVTVFARSWRPTGPVLVLANIVYSLTDPPLRFLRRRIPALSLGSFGIDLSFLALWFGIMIVQYLLDLIDRLL